MKVADVVRVIGTDADLETWRGRTGVVETIKPLLPIPIFVRFEDGRGQYFEEHELELVTPLADGRLKRGVSR